MILAALGMALPGVGGAIFIANANFDAVTLGANTNALGVQSWPAGTGGSN